MKTQNQELIEQKLENKIGIYEVFKVNGCTFNKIEEVRAYCLCNGYRIINQQKLKKNIYLIEVVGI